MAAAAGFSGLDSIRCEIRLLGLQPAELDAAIYCIHEVTSIDDPLRPYEALSYAWGTTDASSERTVYINNLPIAVSASLFAALQTLRRTDAVRHLWVDALCIDQANLAEKTQQVALMRRIYTHCERCCIWLGTLGDVAPVDAEGAFHSIAWIAGERDPPELLGDTGREEACGNTIKKLMGLPWWGRIWTVQESVLPPRATLYWGPFELDWNTMYRAADRFFDDDFPDLPDGLWAQNGIVNLQNAMRGLNFSRDEDPLSLLWRWRYREATNPLDKVYGLMGVQEHINLPSGVACDYDMDVCTLYSRVTADLIRDCGSLQPLIGRRGEGSDIEGLPSWAVDWSGGPADPTKRFSDFWTHYNSWGNTDYCADRGLRGVGDGLEMLPGDDKVLRLSGLFVDKVAVVEGRSDGASESEDSLVQLLSRSNSFGKMVVSFFEQHPGKLTDNWMQALLGVAFGRLDPRDLGLGDDVDWDDWFKQMVEGQALFVTEQGRVGLGPLNTEPGYEVWVVGGSPWPLLFSQRKYEAIQREGSMTEPELIFRGDCFVSGIMMGEAVDGREEDAVEIHLF